VIEWAKETFGTAKPIIGMCHLRALPGDPGYGSEDTLNKVVEFATKELTALQNGGVDGVMFSNEFSLPYLTKVPAITVACMARVIGQLAGKIKVPFGVDVLWDPIASLDLAVATDANFTREVFSGVYASDFGLWDTNFGEAIRHLKAIQGKNIRLFFNIVPEAAKYIVGRDCSEIAESTVFNAKPDALCVSGLIAGGGINVDVLKLVKTAVPGTFVFANTGVNLENVEQMLEIADGAIVGTHFKFEGSFQNPTDENRVRVFMEKVKSLRSKPTSEVQKAERD
jgi:membrane complex biogenesis BtpA family protein